MFTFALVALVAIVFAILLLNPWNVDWVGNNTDYDSGYTIDLWGDDGDGDGGD